MTQALCPGTFDPFTYGHLDMVRQCLTFADVVVIGIAENSKKTPLLSLDKRIELAQTTIREAKLDTRVNVEIVEGLIADFCKEHHIDVIAKGLRTSQDFDYENPMSQMNRQIGAPPTVFVGCKPALIHVSSSMVKEVASYGADVYTMVCADTAQALYEAYQVSPPNRDNNVISAR
ncbi:pantetheine-phosphate adenylyltransferase, partial [uncultured Mobiluncus sp.]